MENIIRTLPMWVYIIKYNTMTNTNDISVHTIVQQYSIITAKKVTIQKAGKLTD